MIKLEGLQFRIVCISWIHTRNSFVAVAVALCEWALNILTFNLR